MEWWPIEDLMLDNFDITDEVLTKLPPRLTSLRNLETTNTSFITALPNNTLTHLKFVGPSNPTDLPAILAQHGSSLKSLEFRRPEEAHSPFSADFDINILPTKARNLTHLAINVPRNGTWPLETLTTISSLPLLESADLYMNIASECAQQRSEPWESRQSERDWVEGCVGEEQFQRPFVSKEGLKEVFGHMRRMKEGVALKNLTIWVGDWTKAWDGPLYFLDWLEGKSAKAVCTNEVEGGDEMNKGWCEIEIGEEYRSDKRYWEHAWQ